MKPFQWQLEELLEWKAKSEYAQKGDMLMLFFLRLFGKERMKEKISREQIFKSVVNISEANVFR